jgi:DNA-binding PadR family transcriptional regulator
MSLEHIMLGILRHPASGYDLHRAFDEGPRQFWVAKLSQIYPTLQKMEKVGWLTSRREPSARGPARRVYRRTAAGTRELHAWLHGQPDIGAQRLAYIGQVAFMGELRDLRSTLRFLTRLRDHFEALASGLGFAGAAPGKTAERTETLDDDAFHDLLCVRIGTRSLQGTITACDEAISLVQARLSRDRRREGGIP